MTDTTLLVHEAIGADGAPNPSSSPWAMVSAAEKKEWPPEPWTPDHADAVIHACMCSPVPGEIFSTWVLKGYESLLEKRSNDTFSIDACAIQGMPFDPVLENAVCTVQDVAYRQSGSMRLAIMAGARFACLELLRRSDDLFPLFPKEGEVYDSEVPHWSFVAAAAQLDLLVPDDAPFFDAGQLRFLAMCCADFENPWCWSSQEGRH